MHYTFLYFRIPWSFSFAQRIISEYIVLHINISLPFYTTAIPFNGNILTAPPKTLTFSPQRSPAVQACYRTKLMTQPLMWKCLLRVIGLSTISTGWHFVIGKGLNQSIRIVCRCYCHNNKVFAVAMHFSQVSELCIFSSFCNQSHFVMKSDCSCFLRFEYASYV